jgi:hypothetical protein
MYRPEIPERFDCIRDAKAFCRDFFNWSNNVDYHSGLNCLTPTMVHFGRTGPVLERRQPTLDCTRQRYPEPFVNAPRNIAGLPGNVWINPPAPEQAVA